MTNKSEEKTQRSLFPIDRLIDDTEKQKLLETMQTPGWRVIHQLIDKVQLDWADQFLGRSLSDLSVADEEMFKDLLHKKGMRDGIIKLFNALSMWKKARERERELDNKSAS